MFIAWRDLANKRAGEPRSGRPVASGCRQGHRVTCCAAGRWPSGVPAGWQRRHVLQFAPRAFDLTCGTSGTRPDRGGCKGLPYSGAAVVPGARLLCLGNHGTPTCGRSGSFRHSPPSAGKIERKVMPWGEPPQHVTHRVRLHRGGAQGMGVDRDRIGRYAGSRSPIRLPAVAGSLCSRDGRARDYKRLTCCWLWDRVPERGRREAGDRRRRS